eukprot:scaffold8770_cov107-Isochrysis_galbana.AAC.4
MGEGVLRAPRVGGRRLGDHPSRRRAGAERATPVARRGVQAEPEAVAEARRVGRQEEPHRVAHVVQPLKRARVGQDGGAQRGGQGQSGRQPE